MAIPLTTPPRMGNYAKLQLVGAFLPGALVLLELWLIITAPSDPLQSANTAIDGVSDWVMAVAVGLLLLIAYAAGALLRTFSFFLFQERLVPLGLPPVESGHEVQQKLEQTFGEEHVRSSLRRHPALEMALGKDQSKEGRWQVLAYTKLWLRYQRPVLATDNFEYEINFFVAIALPTLLAPVAVVRVSGWFDSRASMLVVAALLGTAVAWLLWHRARSTSNDEYKDSIRNVILAELFSEDAVPVQQNRKPLDPPEDAPPTA